jgi:hypothetical protein
LFFVKDFATQTDAAPSFGSAVPVIRDSATVASAAVPRHVVNSDVKPIADTSKVRKENWIIEIVSGPTENAKA